MGKNARQVYLKAIRSRCRQARKKVKVNERLGFIAIAISTMIKATRERLPAGKKRNII